VALAALLAAAALALAAFPFRHRWWGGLLLAVGEAGVVGGLADWFAVTALFRRPLGLPIPHTALIPANWELLARRLGAMIGDRVLTRDYLLREIGALDVAGLLARAAARLGRPELELLARGLLRAVAGELPSPASARELVERLRALLAGRPVAPRLASALETARKEGWDQQAVAAAARAAATLLDRPAVRTALEGEMEGMLGAYRRRMGAGAGFWIGLADALGLIDRSRLVAALHAQLRAVAADPGHPLRRRIAEALDELPGQLRSDPALAARVEQAKERIVASPAVTGLLADGLAAARGALAEDLAAARPATAAWLAERLDRVRAALAADPALRAELDARLKHHARDLVERYHGRMAELVEGGVRALGPAGAVRLIEEHAGDDLQYIRLNGTVVGGLAGGAIYGLHLAWRALAGG
jgi:uncharacterized membrane-anchored protein YjiN (DUF445 family)